MPILSRGMTCRRLVALSLVAFLLTACSEDYVEKVIEGQRFCIPKANAEKKRSGPAAFWIWVTTRNLRKDESFGVELFLRRGTEGWVIADPPTDGKVDDITHLEVNLLPPIAQGIIDPKPRQWMWQALTSPQTRHEPIEGTPYIRSWPGGEYRISGEFFDVWLPGPEGRNPPDFAKGGKVVATCTQPGETAVNRTPYCDHYFDWSGLDIMYSIYLDEFALTDIPELDGLIKSELKKWKCPVDGGYGG